MKKGNMGNVTISLTEEEEKQFKKLQKEETRGPSDQFRHMMKFYITHKPGKLEDLFDKDKVK